MEQEKDNVAVLHPAYSELQAKRTVIADLRGGTRSLRSKTTAYLPKFPMELSYDVRLSVATLDNLYQKTESVMAGIVFADEIDTTNVAEQLKPLLENVDNQGNNFDVFAGRAFEASFDGAAVILVDAPTAVNVASLEDQQRARIRPYMVLYPQSCVTNWRYGVDPVSQATKLILIVFREESLEPKGEFGYQTVVRYREWRKDGGVFWRVWREVKSVKGETEYVIESAGASELSEIPVAIIGDLDASPPMMDLADLNLKHYQKESSFDAIENLAGVPQFYTVGYDGDALPLSPDSWWQLPGDRGAAIGWAQIDSSGFASLRDSLTRIENRMAMLGLAMLADKNERADLTATEAVLKDVGEKSQLKKMAGQLKDALEQALLYMAQYAGLGDDGGGEIILGASWTQTATQFVEDLEQLLKRADIANRLVDHLPAEWLVKLLGTTTPEALAELLDEAETNSAGLVQTLRATLAPIFENEHPPEDDEDETLEIK